MEKNIHEDCGVAMLRLLKPLSYFKEKYGTWMYGLNKMYLMMEKQHNRGQEGAGIASVKLETQPGNEYMFRERAEGKNAVTEIFANIHKQYKDYRSRNCRCRFCTALFTVRRRALYGAFTLFYHRKKWFIVCSPFLKTQQLES